MGETRHGLTSRVKAGNPDGSGDGLDEVVAQKTRVRENREGVEETQSRVDSGVVIVRGNFTVEGTRMAEESSSFTCPSLP